MGVTGKVMFAGVYTTWCNRFVLTFLEKRVASVFKVKKKNEVLYLEVGDSAFLSKVYICLQGYTVSYPCLCED